MKPKSILIVNIQSLLIGTTENLLRNNSGAFDVVSIYPRELAGLIREIEYLKPEVIIMDEDTYFMEPGDLFASLWKVPNIRLIVLNNREVVASIYDKYEQTIAYPKQLMDIISIDHAMPNAE